MASKSHVALGSAPLVVRRCNCTRPRSGSFTISESGVNNRETYYPLQREARVSPPVAARANALRHPAAIAVRVSLTGSGVCLSKTTRSLGPVPHCAASRSSLSQHQVGDRSTHTCLDDLCGPATLRTSSNPSGHPGWSHPIA